MARSYSPGAALTTIESGGYMLVPSLRSQHSNAPTVNLRAPPMCQPLSPGRAHDTTRQPPGPSGSYPSARADASRRQRVEQATRRRRDLGDGRVERLRVRLRRHPIATDLPDELQGRGPDLLFGGRLTRPTERLDRTTHGRATLSLGDVLPRVHERERRRSGWGPIPVRHLDLEFGPGRGQLDRDPHVSDVAL